MKFSQSVTKEHYDFSRYINGTPETFDQEGYLGHLISITLLENPEAEAILNLDKGIIFDKETRALIYELIDPKLSDPDEDLVTIIARATGKSVPAETEIDPERMADRGSTATGTSRESGARK